MKYYHEFNNIRDIDLIYYEFTLPLSNDVGWVPYMFYYLIGEVSIKIFVNDILLDKKVIDWKSRYIFNKLEDDNNNTVHKSSSSSNNVGIVKLYPGDIYQDFFYLLSPNVLPYRVAIKVKITEPSIDDICIIMHIDKQNIIGKLQVKEILHGNDKIMITI